MFYFQTTSSSSTLRSIQQLRNGGGNGRGILNGKGISNTLFWTYECLKFSLLLTFFHASTTLVVRFMWTVFAPCISNKNINHLNVRIRMVTSAFNRR